VTSPSVPEVRYAAGRRERTREKNRAERKGVYTRHRNCEGKNEERVSLLLSIEQKLCSEWNTSLYVGLYRILHSILSTLKKEVKC